MGNRREVGGTKRRGRDFAGYENEVGELRERGSF
jgi:hypothetical protein